ncbi:MAG: UDP-2,4-diacetamido-2,4,6-trideoxy-beta-L-altropyranose hydrolase [Lachnospiraceae bacterium]|nr:UDP-2,4-diacetamido-2,4,6-trideoxy-beta-L-altropyranose hydrolase [Lachnospiraceae bacterium]
MNKNAAPMILIRTDANSRIATGHMMRTLSIASECKRRNIKVCFVLADNESECVFQKLCLDLESFQTEILKTKFDEPDSEIAAFTDIIAKKNPFAVLIDSYFVTPFYLTEISQIVRTFYLDDLNAFDYPVDVVINYCINAKPPSRTGTFPHGKKYLLGPAYAPLREQFRDLSYHVKKEIKDILITTGGTDEEGLTSKIITAVKETLGESVTCHVVIGVINRHRENLHSLALKDNSLKIYEAYAEMAALMQKCDLAISAAGSTLYELCAVGLPTICFTTADNQRSNAIGLSATKALIYAEDKDFARHISELAYDYSSRKKLSISMQNLVDGYGASRIVDELVRTLLYDWTAMKERAK